MLPGRMPYMMPQQYGYQEGFGATDNVQGQCPIVEPTIEKVVKRDFCHEVPHICPVHTKVINNHIFNHTYVPQYTCSEENILSNIDQGSCCKFI